MPESYQETAYKHSIPSGHSIVVNNLPSQEVCKNTGNVHIARLKANDYKFIYFVGTYTCVEQKQ